MLKLSPQFSTIYADFIIVPAALLCVFVCYSNPPEIWRKGTKIFAADGDWTAPDGVTVVEVRGRGGSGGGRWRRLLLFHVRLRGGRGVQRFPSCYGRAGDFLSYYDRDSRTWRQGR